jgi:hypothetical protein
MYFTWVLLGALASPQALAQQRHCASLHQHARSFGSPNTQAEASSFRQGPNFTVLSNAGALAGAACASTQWASAAFQEAAERLRTTQKIDPQILILISTGSLACSDIFYLPYANDVRGIGYQHYDPREVFDDTAGSRLEGVAFLNDFPYWQANPLEFTKDFRHEVAHRWAARVYAQHSGVAAPVLLGRQLQHWSYFFDTGGSPLEGNAWEAVDKQTFGADTPVSLAEFSDFDLYLMGVLPASEVRPQALVATTGTAVDCLDYPLKPSSPPQTCGRVQFTGVSELIDIQAVIDAEGERSPPPTTATRTLDVAVLVLEQDSSPLDVATCQSLAQMLRENMESFQRSTRGQLVLRNISESQVTCAAVGATVAPETMTEPQSGCAVKRGHTRAHSVMMLLLLLTVLASSRRNI